MNSKDIIEAFTYVAKEKNIEKNNLAGIIEELFTSMIVKKYGEDYEDCFSTIVNMDRGEIEIFHEKMVVDNLKDDIREISVKDAIKTDDTLIVGDMFIDIIDPSIFGRRLIAHAKQHLAQKIKDIEKESVYNEFINKIDNIYSGYVHQIQRDRIFITDNDKIEIIIPKSEQIYNDHFKRGEQIRGLIKTVDFNPGRSPEIIMSRTDNKFLEKLFELEVPEIEDGIIEIKKISRAPGDRSKVIVYSSDRRIDAVGACVGMKGSRIQSIVRELNGEKIDIINWSDQPAIILSRALSPVKPIDLYIDEKDKYALAIFNDDDLAMAIGRNGSNLRLSQDVTGYTITAKSETDHMKDKKVYIKDISDLSDKLKSLLIENDIDDSNKLFEVEDQVLLEIKGLGSKTIDKIKDIVTEYLKKNND